MTIDTGEKVIKTVKDGKVDAYVADSYRQSPHAGSFIPSIKDERLQGFLSTMDRSSLGEGWSKGKEYGVVAESGSREDGTYQAIWVTGGFPNHLVTLATSAGGIKHAAKFEQVTPFHHEAADEFDRVPPLGVQENTLEEMVQFKAEIGTEMLFEGEKYEVTEYGLQEVFS